MNTLSDLTIVILNYNTEAWVSKCVESLQKYVISRSQFKIEVIVVDNHSTDGSPLAIEKKFPWVTLLETHKNLGFSAGNNMALRTASSRYVMLLNSDTECTEQTDIDLLLQYLDAHPDVGVVTPRLELTNKMIDMASHRGEPTPWASFTYFSKLEKIFPKIKLFAQYHQTYKDFSQVHEIDACSGAAMIVRSEVMKKVGYLDEQFFMYAEDLDWCNRIRGAGYKIIYHPGCIIIHHKYKSGKQNTDQKISKKTNQHFYDTMLQYYDKHYQNTYPSIVRWGIKTFISLKKGGL